MQNVLRQRSNILSFSPFYVRRFGGSVVLYRSLCKETNDENLNTNESREFFSPLFVCAEREKYITQCPRAYTRSPKWPSLDVD